jgi:hypothetical protein
MYGWFFKMDTYAMLSVDCEGLEENPKKFFENIWYLGYKLGMKIGRTYIMASSRHGTLYV